MSFFSSILDKLGLGGKDEAAASAPAPAAAPAAPKAEAPAAKPEAPAAPKPAGGVDLGASMPKAISEVDVVAKLEKMASGSGLNWQVSIVDLLKTLGIESSLDARKALATELGCPADLMGDSAKMNVWLHKEVLRRIAKNGGNIPSSMLD